MSHSHWTLVYTSKYLRVGPILMGVKQREGVGVRQGGTGRLLIELDDFLCGA